jgi:hypothetical protein
MLRTILARCFALSLAAIPQAIAQQQEPTDARAAEIDWGVVCLPIHTSEGHEIGLVTEAGINDGEAYSDLANPTTARYRGSMSLSLPRCSLDRGDHIELTLGS